ncbi:hypothetical protein EDD85DRAFT_958051 [Armillaria nabsnona]|nr:hypothetical protein EDD85DRAFT_958051 [Armillaria nabsnona]
MVTATPGKDNNTFHRPGSKLYLQYQARDSDIFQPLVATALERFVPFTCSVVLLVTAPSYGQFILKLNDRRFGFRNSLRMKSDELPWSLSIENRLRHVVEKIHAADVPDWLELLEDDIHKRGQLPDIYTWEDWMWGISTWYRKLYYQKCEVDAYRLLRRLQGHVIPRFYGTPLFPASLSTTSKGPTWNSLKPGMDLDAAETISDQVMDAFRNIKDEICVLHNDIHIGNIILRATDRTPVIIDFVYAMIREPDMSDAKWTEIVRQCSDISAMRSNLAKEKWMRKQTLRPMSDYTGKYRTGKYRTPFHFNKYVEEMPEDYR